MMKKQKNIFRNLYWVLPCIALFAGCENETAQDEPVELQVSPVVAWTRGAIQEATGMDKVAIYATGTDYGNGNNYAIYTNTSGSWGNDAIDKVFLTNVAATINAYYPTTTKHDTGLNIPIALKETDAITAIDNATGTAIASAADEVDCMWATPVTDVTNKSGNGVTLTMNHALSMVSFRVYKDANYKGTGSLTKFVVSNVSSGTMLSKGTNPTMNITTGAITVGTVTAATYTRTITGYTLGTTDATSKKLSFLVLPIDASIGTGNIKATFTVDGADYSVNLPEPLVNSGKWDAGSNYLYTVKLGGTEVEITTVTVALWVEVAGGNLEIK